MEQMYVCNTSVDHLLVFYGPMVDHEPQSQNCRSKKPRYWRKHLENSCDCCALGKNTEGSASQTPEVSKTSAVCSLVSLGLQWQ